jgi:hypothetical protein
VTEQLWEVEVLVDEGGAQGINLITVVADAEDAAVRRAITEINYALTFLRPQAKVVRAKARKSER